MWARGEMETNLKTIAIPIIYPFRKGESVYALTLVISARHRR